jgi:hypothetical protein
MNQKPWRHQQCSFCHCICTIPRINKVGNVRITWHWGAFEQPFLQWKSNTCYIFWVCVRNFSYTDLYSTQCSCAILSSVGCPALQRFPKLFHNQHDFRKKVKNMKRVFWFSLQFLSETFLILKRDEQEMIRYVYWPSCKLPVTLALF